jgi:hypothetical protein
LEGRANSGSPESRQTTGEVFPANVAQSQPTADAGVALEAVRALGFVLFTYDELAVYTVLAWFVIECDRLAPRNL